MTSIRGTWTQIFSSPRLERSSQALCIHDSQIWIFGGEVVPRQPVDNLLDIIDIRAGTDVTARTIPAPSTAPTPTVGSTLAAIDDRLYLFSGRGGLDMAPIEDEGGVWQYHIGQATWDLLKPANSSASYPSGRSYHAMVTNGKDEVYVHAGCPEKGRLSDLWCFNINACTWTSLPNAPEPSRGGTSLAYEDGKLYRMSGFDGSKEQGGSIDMLDLSSKTWTTSAFKADDVQGPEARSVSCLLPAQIGHKKYLIAAFGERDPSSLGHAGAGKMLSDVWAFDIQDHGWCKVATDNPSPAPRGWFGAGVARHVGCSDEILVHGGLAEDNTRLGDVWKLKFE